MAGGQIPARYRVETNNSAFVRGQIISLASRLLNPSPDFFPQGRTVVLWTITSGFRFLI